MVSRNLQNDNNQQLIAVSGAAGSLGQLLVRKIHRIYPLISMDSRTFNNRPADVKHYQAELAAKKTRNKFRQRKIHTVIHIETRRATSTSETATFTRAIKNYTKLLENCDRYDVKKLILLSSADLYGALPSNSQFLTEESPLLSAEMSALRDIDMMTQSFFWKRPDIETVILRPAHITGQVNGLLNQYLRLPAIPVLFGFDPMFQLVHEQDVVSSIMLALQKNIRGIFNIAGPKPVPLKTIIKTLGRSTVEIPHPLAKPVLRHLNKLNIPGHMNPAHINYLRYVCMVDDLRARKELGYQPGYNLLETIHAVDTWQ